MEKELRNEGSANSKIKKQPSTTSIWTEKALLKRLTRSPEARARFVESQLRNGIAFQIRALRNRNRWSQPKLAEEVGTTQNQIYRLEKPTTAKPTISTLKRIAAVFDVALIVRFVPFSQVIAWASGAPFLDRGLSTESLAVPSFAEDISLATARNTISQKEETPAVSEKPHQVKAIGQVLRQDGQAQGQQERPALSQDDIDSAKSRAIESPIIEPSQPGLRMFTAGAGG